MSQTEDQKQQIVRCIRMLEHNDILDYNGHASIRLGSDRMLINIGSCQRSQLSRSVNFTAPSVGDGSWLTREHGQDGRDLLPHLPSIDNHVQGAVLQQEFAPLESVRQRLADGLLNDTGSSKSDECLGFRDIQVSKHGQARRNAARGGVGQD